MGGNFTPGPTYTSARRWSNAGRPALVDRGRSFDHQVVLHAVLIALRLHRERHPWVTSDVADLLIDEQLADHDVVSVQPDPHDGDVRTAVGVDRDEVGETSGFDDLPNGR